MAPTQVKTGPRRCIDSAHQLEIPESILREVLDFVMLRRDCLPSPESGAHFRAHLPHCTLTQENTMRPRDPVLKRRDFLMTMLAGTAFVPVLRAQSRAQETPREVFIERAAEGTPHQGKVLLAVQAHSDDIPLYSAGTVAKLVREGYTGYLVRATTT